MKKTDEVVALHRATSWPGVFTDRHGVQRPMGLDDFLVVAPYNAQVSRLTASLPDGARVGTVDRFQGQQAPVVIVSLATSSLDEIRGNGVPLQPQPAQRRRVPGASPDRGCRQPGAAVGALQHRQPVAPGQRPAAGWWRLSQP